MLSPTVAPRLRAQSASLHATAYREGPRTPGLKGVALNISFQRETVACFVAEILLVEAVRATLGSFGSDSSKSTKFGPDIPYTIPFLFFEGAKKSDTRGRHIGKIQCGRQSFQPQVVFKQPKGVK